MLWRILALVALMAGVMTFVAPVRAGGWATVFLDEDPPASAIGNDVGGSIRHEMTRSTHARGI